VTSHSAMICVVMSQISNVFFTEDNFLQRHAQLRFIASSAMGMTAVIITGGSIFRRFRRRLSESSPAWCSTQTFAVAGIAAGPADRAALRLVNGS